MQHRPANLPAMTLLVRTPPGHEAERRWLLDVVVRRWWGLAWRHRIEERDDVRLELDATVVDEDAPGVTVPEILFATTRDRWLTPASLPSPGRAWRPTGVRGSTVLGTDEWLPVPFGASGAGPLLEDLPEGARLHLDVFGVVFAMLTRYEEQVVTTRDRHDRFPAAEALAFRDGFLGLPLADAAAELLWAACARTWPRMRRHESRYQVRVTHDVDDPVSTLGRGPARQLRALGGDLLRRRDVDLAARRLRSALTAHRGDHARDPNNTFDVLMDTSERHGLRSAFFFLDRREMVPGAAPVDLVGHPWVGDLMDRVHRRGHEVGFHAAYDTHRSPERLAHDFHRLRSVAADRGVEQGHWSGRQHYLQWHPRTWRHWAEAGLDRDATVAFSEAVGFRTGTCRPYPVFDLLERRALDLVEEPFQVMDVTLFHHLDLDPDAAREQTLAVARECHRFGGTLGVLWHNDSLMRTAREQRWYAELVAAVATVTGAPQSSTRSRAATTSASERSAARTEST